MQVSVKSTGFISGTGGKQNPEKKKR